MTIEALHYKLKEIGVPENQYFLHGLFGSTDDNDKIALTIRKGKFGIEYEMYYKERGEKHTSRIFSTEKEVCEYIHKKFIDEQPRTARQCNRNSN